MDVALSNGVAVESYPAAPTVEVCLEVAVSQGVTVEKCIAQGLTGPALTDKLYSSSFASLASFAASIGTTECTLVVDQDETVSADVTIPATVTVEVRQGCVITVATGKTLTINGTLVAGLYQVFSCTGTGAVSGLKEAYPQWFGAVADGTTDCKSALASSVTAVSGGGVISLPAGTYATSDEFKLDTLTGVSIRGAGRDATIIKPTSGTTGITGIWLYKCTRCTVRDLTVKDFLDVGAGEVMGIHVEGGWQNTVTGCYITNCDNSGIRLGYDRTAYNALDISTKCAPTNATVVALDGGKHHVHNNHIYDIDEGHGIEIIRSNSNLVHHNTIETLASASGYGIRCVGSIDTIIDHNWIYNVKKHGIVVSSCADEDGGTSYITKTSSRCIVDGNLIICTSTMEDSAYGIYFALGTERTVISNNLITLPATSSTTGIGCPSGYTAYTTTWAYDFNEVTIDGNIINGCYYGISSVGRGNGMRITNNMLNSFQSRGIYLSAPASLNVTGMYVDGNVLNPLAGASGTRYGIQTANSTSGNLRAVIGRNMLNPLSIGDTYYPIYCSNDTAADCQFLPINVADFGAIGDNSTDDSVPINYAVSAVNRCPIGELHFPDKTYVTTAGLDAITNTNCKVTGHPPAALTGGFPRPEVGGTTSAADELAIPVTHSYVAKTTGGDAEALTLADGQPGQVLVICLVTDGGGDGTLTPTTKSGFATIVFADVGDTAALLFTNATTGWVILGTAGVAAPPVITT